MLIQLVNISTRIFDVKVLLTLLSTEKKSESVDPSTHEIHSYAYCCRE
jgi:hypothetical protein